jgi:hypothetical protein
VVENSRLELGTPLPLSPALIPEENFLIWRGKPYMVNDRVNCMVNGMVDL